MIRGKRPHRALVALVAAAWALVVAPAVWMPPVAEAQPGCRTITPPAHRYALTIDDFGRGGGARMIADDESYYLGLGYYFGYDRDDWEFYMAHPHGGYLIGGVVLFSDESWASADVRNSVQGWTREWQRVEFPPVSGVGDEIVVATRLTPWEIEQDQPMTEVFFSFRRCNATAHALFAVMPRYEPVTQALRYARIIDGRFQR